MPRARAPFRASLVLGRVLAAVTRVAGVAIVTGFGLFALILLAVRFIVFPQVETYRDTLTAALSRQLGQPVEIAALSTGWDGWNPKIVISGFSVRDVNRGVPLLELPEVDLVVAWTSLPRFELRLKQLTIERPRLAVRRDRGGRLHLAGLEFDPDRAADDTRVTDWILRQRQIVVRDALVTWNDDLRNAPQLVLDRVQFRLESRFGVHRFGLRGTPPSELAAPLDLRGVIRGALPKQWQDARGELYVRLDYADVDAWREWLPLPPAISSGKGAIRAWFRFAEGEAREIVADLELVDVKAKLDEKLPPLELSHLSGRAGWRNAPPQHEFFTSELSFVTRGGQRLEPTTLSATMRDATVDTAASGSVEFDRLQIDPLRDLASELPLPEALRADFARFAPRGALSQGRVHWEGLPDAPTSLSAAAAFDRLGVAAQGAFPGCAGISGTFAATLAGGEVTLASHGGELAFPRALAEPIPFDRLQGSAHWENKGGRTRVDVRTLEFANAHAAGSIAGTYRSDPNGPGEIDVAAHLTRGDPAEIHRYLPLAVHPAVRDWLRASLVKGSITEARLKLAGNLAQFPFTDPKRGQFLMTAKGRGVTFAYWPGWPEIDGIDGEIRFEGAGMTIDAVSGQLFGAQLGRTRASVPDLRNPQLTIEGTARGPVADFLRFVEESPVGNMIDHATTGAGGDGDGTLALKLVLPIKKPEATKVSGEFTFENGELRFPDVPTFTRINGSFQFTESDLRAPELSLEVLGGPAKLSLASADGRAVRVSGNGNANLALLRRMHGAGYLSRVSGTADWNVNATVRPGNSSWVLESPLRGAAIDLPAPLGKSAGEAMPLRLERRDVSADEDRIDASYGRMAQVAVHRRFVKDGAVADRVLISLGRAAGRPEAARAERPGIWVRAELQALNIDDWVALRNRERSDNESAADALPSLEGFDLDVGDLAALGRRWNEIRITGRRSEGDWNLDLRGREVAGTGVWSTPDALIPNGRVVARLARFTLPKESAPNGPAAPDKGAETKADGRPNPWPEIDITADAFSSKGRDLGNLELVAKPEGADWRIEKLVLSSDKGRIEASGAWRTQGRTEQTSLDVDLDATDAGAFLARYGYPDALQGAPTRIDGQLAWAGAPNDFDFPTLTGSFHVAVGPGRFVKIEPGFGKLLGVLSLQALPRRISLDFRDVFSEGFAFDDINGDVKVANGVMNTDNLLLQGPAAKVNIAGDADLAKETQRLTVRVQPALSGGVSAGAALLFLANPIVGAAVGAGSLLAQKVMRDPIEQMFSYQYTVTGSWSDPVVTRSGASMVSTAPGAPGVTPESANR
jgi:uncharacterized protein (TIGR02099 family)